MSENQPQPDEQAVTSERITDDVRDMLAIIDSPESTEDDREMARSTIAEVLFPDLLEKLYGKEMAKWDSEARKVCGSEPAQPPAPPAVEVPASASKCFLLEDDPPEQHGEPIACTQCWNALSEQADALREQVAAYSERDCQMKDRLDGVYGALCDAATVTVRMDDPGESVRELVSQRDRAISDVKASMQAARAWAALANGIEAIRELETFDEMTSDQQKLDAYIQSWTKMKERAESAETKVARLEREVGEYRKSEAVAARWASEHINQTGTLTTQREPVDNFEAGEPGGKRDDS